MDWEFYNEKHNQPGTKREWKSVASGEVHHELTIVKGGTGNARVEARCSCGRPVAVNAASIANGRIKRCERCEEINVVWKHPEKWVNPKPLDDRDKAIISARQEEERARQEKQKVQQSKRKTEAWTGTERRTRPNNFD